MYRVRPTVNRLRDVRSSTWRVSLLLMSRRKYWVLTPGLRGSLPEAPSHNLVLACSVRVRDGPARPRRDVRRQWRRRRRRARAAAPSGAPARPMGSCVNRDNCCSASSTLRLRCAEGDPTFCSSTQRAACPSRSVSAGEAPGRRPRLSRALRRSGAFVTLGSSVGCGFDHGGASTVRLIVVLKPCSCSNAVINTWPGGVGGRMSPAALGRPPSFGGDRRGWRAYAARYVRRRLRWRSGRRRSRSMPWSSPRSTAGSTQR